VVGVLAGCKPTPDKSPGVAPHQDTVAAARAAAEDHVDRASATPTDSPPAARGEQVRQPPITRDRAARAAIKLDGDCGDWSQRSSLIEPAGDEAARTNPHILKIFKATNDDAFPYLHLATYSVRKLTPSAGEGHFAMDSYGSIWLDVDGNKATGCSAALPGPPAPEQDGYDYELVQKTGFRSERPVGEYTVYKTDLRPQSTLCDKHKVVEESMIRFPSTLLNVCDHGLEIALHMKTFGIAPGSAVPFLVHRMGIMEGARYPRGRIAIE